MKVTRLAFHYRLSIKIGGSAESLISRDVHFLVVKVSAEREQLKRDKDKTLLRGKDREIGIHTEIQTMRIFATSKFNSVDTNERIMSHSVPL